MIRTPARTPGFALKALLAAGAMTVAGAAVSAPAQALESRTFVVGWFSEATYSQDTDCVGGINPNIDDQYLKNLADLGYTLEDGPTGTAWRREA